MERSEKRLTCAQVKELDLVQYLAELGFQPQKVKEATYWYLSPLRNETTASFKVNRKLNRWYDFGSGQGGSVIDFGIRYFNCTVKEFIHGLSGVLPVVLKIDQYDAAPEAKIIINQVKPISAPSLIKYAATRGLGLELVAPYCHQVHYQLNYKRYYGIGFANDSGGYEIRNAFFKCSSSPKDVTSIKGGNHCLSVFEGFIDFLSFLILFDKSRIGNTDFLILNSLSFFERSMEFMLSYRRSYLYLDNDAAGHNCCITACKQSKIFARQDHLYRDYKDLNDWLMGKPIAAIALPTVIDNPT